MYEINPKFFNNDGSLDVEAACAAGRKARAPHRQRRNKICIEFNE